MSNIPKDVINNSALKITMDLYPIVFVSLELCSFPLSKKKKKKDIIYIFLNFLREDDSLEKKRQLVASKNPSSLCLCFNWN